MPEYIVEFYADADGKEPVLQWLWRLPSYKRRAATAALEQVLGRQGSAICRSGWGRWVRGVEGGIFELRIRQDYGTIMRNTGVAIPAAHAAAAGERHGEILLRIFCHAYGEHVVLLLAAYDKREDPSPRRQASEAKLAEKRLRDWRQRRRREVKRSRRRPVNRGPGR
jgi:phage-related protein